MSTVGRLDAFALRDDVVDVYKDYARGFITIADPHIRHEVEEELASGRLWPDPYVQINPRYAQSDTIEDLVSDGTFHPQMADVFDGFTFYEHQTEAFNLAANDIPFVVTTGTGSGKSLTYMAPIINDVLNNIDGHGIRAIIVYPMNALANSQYEALREFLPGGCMNEALDDDGVFDPSKITNDVTFGRYIGSTDFNVRDAMVERPPNILLTNYVMLELLLTRVWDRNLLGNADQLKWLVLDELHTYRGRQGADVGMLLRRVKHTAGRLKNANGPRDIVHIGTSATMAAGDEVTPEQAREQVAIAATTLFGARIDPDHVIGETLVRTTALANGGDAAVKAALSDRSWVAPTGWPTFKTDPVASYVETLVGSEPNDEDVLVRSKPMRAEQIAERLAAVAGLDLDADDDNDYVQAVVREILRAGNTIVVDEPGERPTAAFPFRLHQFVTRGDNVFTTVDPPARREITLEEQEFLPGDRGRSLFNVAFCRECGFEYLPVEQWVRPEDGVTVYSRRDPYERNAFHDPSDGVRGFLFVPRGDVDWPRIGYDDKNYRDPDILSRVPDEWVETTDAGTTHVRGSRNTSPRKYLPEPVSINGNGVTSHGPDTHEVFFMPAPFKRCLACGVEYGGGWSDLPRLATLGLSGRSTATTILTLSVLEYLAKHHDEAEQAGLDASALLPKLLNFTDNRQDASLQAGHFNDFIQTVSLRAALVRAVDHADGSGTDLTVENVAAAVLEQTGLTLDDYGVDVTDKQAAFPVGKSARKTMLDLIRHRVMVDAGGGKSLTQPNLENVGLATIDYDGLDALAAADDMWADAAANRSRFVDQQDTDGEPDPTLAKTSHLLDATPAERELVARTLLDYLRRNHIIRDKGLDPDHLAEMKWQIGERIQSPFDGGIDKDSRLTEWSMMAARGRINNSDDADPGTTSTRYVSPQSGFGRWMNANAFGEKLTRRYAADTLQHLLNVLITHGYLVKVSEAPNGDTLYGIDSSTLLWKPGTGRPVADPVRVPNRPTVADEQDTDAEGLSVAPTAVNEFFRDLYLGAAEQMGKFEGREHTAQIQADEREEREDRFRDNDLHALFCSPTMELGIDIAGLNVVGMRNVPPTPANYAQRAGRAGRSGQAALVVVYASIHSPHDRWYFADPVQMVAGSVSAPRLDLLNEDLIRSHVHAIWIAQTGANLGTSMTEDVLDVDTSGSRPTFTLKDDLAKAFADPNAATTTLDLARKVIGEVEGITTARWWVDDPNWLDQVVAAADASFQKATKRWRDMYESAFIQLEQASEQIKSPSRRRFREKRTLDALHREAQRALDLLKGDGTHQTSDFNPYRYFGSEGFLPGYSFPRLPLSAFIPSSRGTKSRPQVTRPRFLAISEFGPRTFIYHNGAKYRVTSVMLPVSASELSDEGAHTALHTGRLCNRCGYFIDTSELPDTDTDTDFGDAAAGAGLSNCPNCKTDLGSTHIQRFDQLFKMTGVHTRRQTHISSAEEERTRAGFDIRTAFTFPTDTHGNPYVTRADAAAPSDEPLLELTYAPSAKLTKINMGYSRRKEESELGFHLDLSTGKWVTGANDPDESTTDESGEGVSESADDPEKPEFVRRVIPFVNDYRNTLLVKPTDELLDGVAASDRAGLLASFESAFASAVTEKYLLEPSELVTVPLPTRDDGLRDSFAVYEDSEGGAGALRQLIEEPGDLSDVARRALQRCHWAPDDNGQWTVDTRAPDLVGKSKGCEAGCYDCLLSYGNQPDHPILDRKDPDGGTGLRTVLERLLAVTVDAELPTTAPPAEVTTSHQPPKSRPERRGDTRDEALTALLNGTGSGQERRWLTHVADTGLRLPDKGQYQIPDVNRSADFVYLDAPTKTLVFVDGHPHCNPDAADNDHIVTLDCEEAGYRVLRFAACPDHRADQSTTQAWDTIIDANPDVFGGRPL